MYPAYPKVNNQPLKRLACNCALPQFRENGFGFITRYDWRVDYRPTTNIDRRDLVSKASEPAKRLQETP